MSITFCVWAITYVCIDGLPSNLVKTLTWIHTSKIKVTQYIYRSEYTCSCLRYNLRIHWWITILLGTNVVLVETMCSDLDPDPYLKRSRSHETFKSQSTHARVRAITYICIDGLPSNLVQMLSSLKRCAYIQEYLGYQSNNLYFLFAHSWPLIVYNFGQVQHTSQVERTSECSKKQWRGYSHPLDCLVLDYNVKSVKNQRDIHRTMPSLHG